MKMMRGMRAATEKAIKFRLIKPKERDNRSGIHLLKETKMQPGTFLKKIS